MSLSLKIPSRPLAAIGAALLAASIGGVAAPPATAAPAPSAISSGQRINYVNLGDSYGAGWGAYAPDQSANLDAGSSLSNCLVGGRPDHITLLSEVANVSLAGDFACEGATVGPNSNVPTVGQEITAANNAQKLTNDTDLVTVTAGGNDVNFGAIIGTCAQGTLLNCQQAIAGGLVKASAIDVAGTLRAIHADARRARIAWIGYPHLFSANGGGIMSPEAAAVFNAGTDAFNATLAAKVAAAGFINKISTQYVNVTSNFTGHEIGSAAPWFNLVDPTLNPDLAPFNFHPNADGYQLGYYPAMASQINLAGAALLPAS